MVDLMPLTGSSARHPASVSRSNPSSSVRDPELLSPLVLCLRSSGRQSDAGAEETSRGSSGEISITDVFEFPPRGPAVNPDPRLVSSRAPAARPALDLHHAARRPGNLPTSSSISIKAGTNGTGDPVGSKH